MRTMTTMLIAGVLHLTGAVVAQAPPRPDPAMSFFVTSTGPRVRRQSGRTLAGADAHCQRLAAAAGRGEHKRRAYLSAPATREAASGARARPDWLKGPWFTPTAAALRSPSGLVDLHSTTLTASPRSTPR